MTNQTKPYYRTRSPEEYKRKYPNAGVILDLDQKSLRLSASKWGKEHLIACRVIQHAGGKILPILKEFAPEPKDLKRQEEWVNIKRLVNGRSKDDLRYKSRLELEREDGNLGTLWSALAKCVASQEAGESKKYPQRERKQTEREGFVSSSHMQISLNSPPEAATQSSKQSFEPRSPYGREVDEDKHDMLPTARQRSEGSSLAESSQESYKPGSSNCGEVGEDEHCDRTKSEVVTVNLAGAFIRYVLNFCAGQNPAVKWMLEFREEPVRLYYNLPSIRIDATDDGGIWGVKKQDEYPWEWDRRLALLEAKKAFQHIDDDNRLVVSDANWSQYTCEALTACLDNPDQNEVFVITMTQTFMRFLHFHRTEDYMQYLRSNNVEQQRVSDAYLHMTDTELFALDSREGRRYAVCNLLGLVKFWEEQRRQEVKGVEKAEGSREELGRDDDDINSGDPEGSEEGDSEVDIDNSSGEDYSPRARKRKRRFS